MEPWDQDESRRETGGCSGRGPGVGSRETRKGESRQGGGARPQHLGANWTLRKQVEESSQREPCLPVDWIAGRWGLQCPGERQGSQPRDGRGGVVWGTVAQAGPATAGVGIGRNMSRPVLWGQVTQANGEDRAGGLGPTGPWGGGARNQWRAQRVLSSLPVLRMRLAAQNRAGPPRGPELPEAP